MTDGPVYLVHLVMDSDPTLAACTGTPWSHPRDAPPDAKFQFCEGCRMVVMDALRQQKPPSIDPSTQEPNV